MLAWSVDPPSLVSVLPSFVHLLLIHGFTPTHQAPETLLQQFWLALCHLLKDDLGIVVRIFLNTRAHRLQLFPASRAMSRRAPFLHPELLHGNRDLPLHLLAWFGWIAGEDLVGGNEEDIGERSLLDLLGPEQTCARVLLAILGPVERQEE